MSRSVLLGIRPSRERPPSGHRSAVCPLPSQAGARSGLLASNKSSIRLSRPRVRLRREGPLVAGTPSSQHRRTAVLGRRGARFERQLPGLALYSHSRPRAGACGGPVRSSSPLSHSLSNPSAAMRGPRERLCRISHLDRTQKLGRLLELLFVEDSNAGTRQQGCRDSLLMHSDCAEGAVMDVVGSTRGAALLEHRDADAFGLNLPEGVLGSGCELGRQIICCRVNDPCEARKH